VRGEASLRADVVEVGRRLYAKGFIAGNEGNVSVRAGDQLYVTPGGACKGFLAPGDVVVTDLDGRPRAGAARDQRDPDARRRLPAAPRCGGGRARPSPGGDRLRGGRAPLDRPILAEPVVTLGPVPVVPSDAVHRRSGRGRLRGRRSAHALLLANHGALTVGETLWRAWERMETLEQFARSRSLRASWAARPS